MIREMLKPHSLIYGLVGVIVLATGIACVSFQSGISKSPTPSATTPSPSATSSPIDEAASERDRPDTKIITMNLEGRSTEVELRLYEKESLPFFTYYPTKNFTPEFKPLEEGDRLRFYFTAKGKKDEEAYVSFFQPDETTSPEAMLETIMGADGLLVRNKWELVDRTDIVSYPWAVEKLIYQQQKEDDLIVGAIYIGAKDGQAFYVLTHYSEEYSDRFDPTANIMLENLQFNDEG